MKWCSQVIELADASADRWLDAETGAFRGPACFSHLLAEVLLGSDALDEGRDAPSALRGLEFLHEQARDPEGRYGTDWDKPLGGPLSAVTLIDQASAARAFLYAARKADDEGRGR